MPIDSDPTRELLTVGEVAELLAISEPGVRRLIDRRIIPYFKVMRSIRFDKKDILSYLSNNRVEPIGSITYDNTENKKIMVG